eukprot:c4381_g1_i1.p1 GENE.c4381_g1_i1~~c4381_g1_i1.p1  ORF type:complete len:313 (+),score=52.98 c4381_g1_i1:44-982(+)
MFACGSQEAKNAAQETAQFIKTQIPPDFNPKVAIICGSGLDSVIEDVDSPLIIPFSGIPNYPLATVPGHSGAFAFGKLGGIDVVVMKGRLHYYEGHTFEQVTRGVRTFAELGVETVVVTNAAGAANPSFSMGDIMMITDHYGAPTLAAMSPLIGPSLGERFLDLSAAYSPRLKDLVRHCIEAHNSTNTETPLAVQEGVFGWVGGPNYETPAETHALHTLGVDCVAMSTVPEVILARHCGMRCVGFSIVSNSCLHAAPRTESEYIEMKSRMANHTLVLQEVGKAIPKFRKLVKLMMEAMASDPDRWGRGEGGL